MDKLSRDDIIRYLSIAHPVTGMLVYRGNVAILQRDSGPMATVTRGDRKKIKYLSKRARARLAFVALATPVEFESLITLTYPAAAPIDGLTVKHNLRTLLKALERAYGCNYLWVIEFQARGAPHFHIVTEVTDITEVDRIWLATTWTRCIGFGELPFRKSGLDQAEATEAGKCVRVHCHPKAWENIREKEGGRHYMVKEATKTRQKIVPEAYSNVGRFWGCSREVTERIEPIAKIPGDEQTVRDMLEAFGSRVFDMEILPKMIYCVDIKPSG